MNFGFFDSGVFHFDLVELRALFPYLALCVGMLFTTIASAKSLPVFVHKIILTLTLAAFAISMAMGLGSAEVEVFGGSLVLDESLRWVSIGIATLAFLALISVYDLDHSEWSTLMLVSITGMTMLPGARNWISFFVFLETMAIPAYVMAAFRQNRDGGYEAGIKYLLLGAFASALLLMGMTLIFGATGSFDYKTIREVLEFGLPSNLVIAAVILLVVAASFKVAMAPLHMWAADIYQSAPSSLAAFMAGAGKLSVFTAIVLAWNRCGFFNLSFISTFVTALAILSILLGNLMALNQKSLRRMLAYSSVASAGYVAMVIPFGEAALPGIFVYLMTYGVALSVAFASIESLSAKAGHASSSNFSITDLSLVPFGKAKVETFFLTLALFSMAGIPPLPGFLGKYLLISDIWTASPMATFWIILGSMMGLAYYLRILVPLYFEKSQVSGIISTRAPLPRTVLGSAGVGIFTLFLLVWIFAKFFSAGGAETMLSAVR